MHIIANIYLVLFTIDVIVSFADELLGFAGIGVLSTLRMNVAGTVFLSSFVIYIAAGITTKLPKRVTMVPALFIIWATLGAPPLGLFIEASTLVMMATMMQGGVAAFAFNGINKLTEGRSWLLGKNDPQLPAFSWRNSLAFATANFVLAPPLIALGGGLMLAHAVDGWTAGFAQLKTDGLYCSERTYRRDDKTVTLIATIHIGDPDYYKQLTDLLPTDSKGIVLIEGVTDSEGLMTERLDYRPLAERFGLSSQQAELEIKPDHRIRHADIDISELSPEAIGVIKALAAALSSGTKSGRLDAYRTYTAANGSPDVPAILHELIHKRNSHLLEEMRLALKDHDEVLVPWGAAHMPGLERALLRRGFEPQDSKERRAISFNRLPS